jgi:SNF2 family DNA or RNA helicase
VFKSIKHVDLIVSIVFSSWKTSLDIACQLFKEEGIAFLKLDGDVPYAKRKDVINKFQQSDSRTVLLMTLGIGAVG